MKRVIEAYEKCGHFEESPFGSSLECSLLLGLLVDFGLEMHVGHGLSLEHGLGLEGLHKKSIKFSSCFSFLKIIMRKSVEPDP